MKSLHKFNEKSPDMAPVSLTSGTFQSTGTTTSMSTNSSAYNNVLYIKYSVALAGLNKMETKSTNPDIAELANVICITINLN